MHATPNDVEQIREDCTKRILEHNKRNIFEVAELLHSVKQTYSNDKEFLAWAKSKIGWSKTHVYDYINVYKRQSAVADSVRSCGLSEHAILTLLAPSTPNSVIEEVTAKLETGQKVTAKQIEELNQKERELKQIQIELSEKQKELIRKEQHLVNIEGQFEKSFVEFLNSKKNEPKLILNGAGNAAKHKINKMLVNNDDLLVEVFNLAPDVVDPKEKLDLEEIVNALSSLSRRAIQFKDILQMKMQRSNTNNDKTNTNVLTLKRSES